MKSTTAVGVTISLILSIGVTRLKSAEKFEGERTITTQRNPRPRLTAVDTLSNAFVLFASSDSTLGYLSELQSQTLRYILPSYNVHKPLKLYRHFGKC